MIAAMPAMFGGSVRRRFRGLGWGLVAAGVIAVSILVIIGAISAHGDVAFNRWVGWATIIALPFAAIGIVLVLVEKIGRDRDRDRQRSAPLTKLLADETPAMSMYGNSIAEVARQAITQIRKSR